MQQIGTSVMYPLESQVTWLVIIQCFCSRAAPIDGCTCPKCDHISDNYPEYLVLMGGLDMTSLLGSCSLTQ